MLDIGRAFGLDGLLLHHAAEIVGSVFGEVVGHETLIAWWPRVARAYGARPMDHRFIQLCVRCRPDARVSISLEQLVAAGLEDPPVRDEAVAVAQRLPRHQLRRLASFVCLLEAVVGVGLEVVHGAARRQLGSLGEPVRVIHPVLVE